MKIAGLPSTRRKNLTIILILVIGLPILVYASFQIANLITNAGTESNPNNVVISNLTTNSATISWTTEQTTRGSVIPVLNGNEETPKIDKRGNDKRNTHYVELTDLDPNTEYQYLIVSENNKYSDESGKEFKFKTAPVSTEAPTPNPIYGSISGGSNDDTIIYAFLKDKSTYPVSAVIPSGGNWIVDLSTLRDLDDKSLVITKDDTNLVLVAVSETTKADLVEGAYLDLFDSNGKLKDTYPLALEQNETYYSYFPSETKVQAQEVVEEEPSTYVPPTTPVVTEPEETDEDFDREYILTSDLQWIDMVTGSSNISTGTVGEESIVVTNLTDTGFTVLWVSGIKEEGSVEYGEISSNLNEEASDERDGLTNKGEYYVHSVNITMLSTETDYYFKVISGEDEYTNSDNYYLITTFSTLNSPPPFQSVTGTVEGVSDEVAVIGYFEDKDDIGSSGNSMRMSTMTDEDGRWIMSIADTRTEDGSEYYESSDGDNLVFKILSLVDTDSQDENVDGVEERDVELEVDESLSSLTFYEVSKLADYGLVNL